MSQSAETRIARKDHADGGGLVVDSDDVTLERPDTVSPDEEHLEEVVVEPPEARPPWTTTLVAVGGCLLLIFGLFHETAWSMIRTWWGSGSYGHGLLVAPLALYLIWRRRFILEAVMPSPDFRGVFVLAGAVGLWLIGDVAGLQIVKQYALVAMIPAVLLTVLGWPLVRRMAFPLFFLFLAVPFGDFLIAPLQDLTAVASVRMLQWSGVPVYTDGLLIYIPSGSFIVAEACSGVRYLIVAIALGFLGAHLFYESWWRRGLFIALSVVVPIIANAIRAYGIVYIAHVTDHEYAVGVDHLIYGWIFLSFVTLLLLGIGMTFREVRHPVPDHRVVDWSDIPEDTTGTGRRVIAAALTASLVVVAAPIYARHIGQTSGPDDALDVTGPDVAGWTRTEPHEPLWLPAFRGSTADIHSGYVTADGASVDLYVGYYRRQTQDAEVTNELNLLYPDDWMRTGGGRTVAEVDGETVTVQANLIRHGRDLRLAWSWYWVDDTFTDNRLVAKLHEVKAKLLGGRDAAAIVAVAAPFSENPAEAERVLGRFLADAAPVQGYLDAIADRDAGR